ncbi:MULTISPECIES: TetR/AcrR family transcriptional regulator [unclassified Streptosporangium]|uniref:TetR/AcrR family transcriptional regulator n=1 Tax=unclassified Streptosporangium TaxID=2632669 RepID=UPI002E2BB54B|nr:MULTISPECIES: TetR/AcrR family transcriptional regulator [unclassified Streptosporangium]
MGTRQAVRTGGRSARVQQAVHDAVRQLLTERDRADLTVPLVAARAGVTPSTVYRRWGDLQELLADVALEHMRPDGPPTDLGNLRDDLAAWAEEWLEEMSSPTGRAVARDVVAGDGGGRSTGQCCAYASSQIEAVLTRAAGRGEDVPALDAVLDHVLAPMMYRVLFISDSLAPGYGRALVDTLLGPR